MRKNKALFALLLSVLAVTLFAAPLSAKADETVTTITQDSFNDGVYAISEPGNYELGEDVTGKIAIDKENGGAFAINLKGYTLTNANGGNAIFCKGSGHSATLTVSNGSIVATGKSVQAVRIDAHLTTVELDGVSVDTTDGICVHVQTATAVNIKGGSYKTSNKTEGVDEPVLCVAGGTLNVNGGDSVATLTLDGGTNIVKNDGKGSAFIKLSGGTFSASPPRQRFPIRAPIAFTRPRRALRSSAARMPLRARAGRSIRRASARSTSTPPLTRKRSQRTMPPRVTSSPSFARL